MAERFSPLGLTGPYDYRDQMVRDDRLKLIRTQDGARSLYDLSVDPWEAEDLLAGPSASAWVAEADRLELALEGALAAPVVPEARGGGASRVAVLAAGVAGLAMVLWGAQRWRSASAGRPRLRRASTRCAAQRSVGRERPVFVGYRSVVGVAGRWRFPPRSASCHRVSRGGDRRRSDHLARQLSAACPCSSSGA
jgi:hypothetical protein